MKRSKQQIAKIPNYRSLGSVQLAEGEGFEPSVRITVRRLSLAEGEGFEPSVRITVRRLSRAVHSTTLPPFRGDVS